MSRESHKEIRRIKRGLTRPHANVECPWERAIKTCGGAIPSTARQNIMLASYTFRFLPSHHSGNFASFLHVCLLGPRYIDNLPLVLNPTSTLSGALVLCSILVARYALFSFGAFAFHVWYGST